MTKTSTLQAMVDRPRVGDSSQLVFSVPFPPSLNNLFINVRGRGRVPSQGYTSWRIAAGLALNQQNLGRIDGPVNIQISFQDDGRCDLDNLAKGIIDLCVSSHLIDGDGRKIVRSLLMRWDQNLEGARVVISRAK